MADIYQRIYARDRNGQNEKTNERQIREGRYINSVFETEIERQLNRNRDSDGKREIKRDKVKLENNRLSTKLKWKKLG